ncbi:MAG: hypothetical protein ACPG4N_04570, partial [Gammaproteobacteria bacterium]
RGLSIDRMTILKASQASDFPIATTSFGGYWKGRKTKITAARSRDSMSNISIGQIVAKAFEMQGLLKGLRSSSVFYRHIVRDVEIKRKRGEAKLMMLWTKWTMVKILRGVRNDFRIKVKSITNAYRLFYKTI